MGIVEDKFIQYEATPAHERAELAHRKELGIGSWGRHRKSILVLLEIALQVSGCLR